MFTLVLALAVEAVIPDIGDYNKVAQFPCNPPNEPTRMCIVFEKDGKQIMSTWDIKTKQPVEVRDEKKVLWRFDWLSC